MGIGSHRSQQLTSGLGFLAGCRLWPGGSLGKGLTWCGCGALGLGARGHLLFLKFSRDSLSPGGEQRGVPKTMSFKTNPHLPLRCCQAERPSGRLAGFGWWLPCLSLWLPSSAFSEEGRQKRVHSSPELGFPEAGPAEGPTEQPETRPWDRLPLPAADFCLSFGASGRTQTACLGGHSTQHNSPSAPPHSHLEWKQGGSQAHTALPWEGS